MRTATTGACPRRACSSSPAIRGARARRVPGAPVGRWRLTAIAGKADSEASFAALATSSIASMPRCSPARTGCQLPTGRSPIDYRARRRAVRGDRRDRSRLEHAGGRSMASPLFMRDVSLTLKLVAGRHGGANTTATSHRPRSCRAPGDEVTYSTLCAEGSYSSSGRRPTRCTSSRRRMGRRTGSPRSSGITTASSRVPVPGARRRRDADGRRCRA